MPTQRTITPQQAAIATRFEVCVHLVFGIYAYLVLWAAIATWFEVCVHLVFCYFMLIWCYGIGDEVVVNAFLG